jgi:hypothetical protein
MDMIGVDLAAKRTFTSDEARAIATELGIDFGALGRDLGRWGLMSELEPGPRDEFPGNPCELRDSSQTGAGPSGEARVASE